MKKIIIFSFFFVIIIPLLAQNSDKGFSFQALARTTDGAIRANENIFLQLSLLPGQGNVSAAHIEAQMATTDEFGVFSIIIGKGNRTGGTASSFAAVNFGSADYWLKIEIDENGNYVELATQQLLSVPYAANAANGVPSGTIIAFASETPPPGYLLCNGASYSRSEYPNLFNAIGSTWGSDDENTFKVPDLRGQFLRGWSQDKDNIDPDKDARVILNDGNGTTNGTTGNHVGSFQPDGFASHRHGLNERFGSATIASSERSHVLAGANGSSGGSVATGTDSGPVRLSGGNETRPENAYVNYIIKY